MKALIYILLPLLSFFGVFTVITTKSGCGDFRVHQTRSDFGVIISHLDAYKMLNGNYPTQEQGLIALVQRPETESIPKEWVPAYREEPRDGWGNRYLYRFPGSKDPKEPEIISLSLDGVVSEDDMLSQD
ncbi:MAG: type II secretion system protein GspG [Akkermansiaceae bacterium]